MKMSKKNFKTFKEFYDFTVENASDTEVDFILRCVLEAAKSKTGRKNFNSSHPFMSDDNYNIIKGFFEEFASEANDNDALYLIEGINALCREAHKNKRGVLKFIERKKKEYAKKSN